MKFDFSIVQARVHSPLGTIAIAATDQGLAGLWFTEGQRYLPPELTAALTASHDDLSAQGVNTTDAAPSRKTAGAVPSRKTAGAAPSRQMPIQPAWPSAAAHPVLQAAGQQLAEYFAGQRRHFELPLDLSSGTAFQQSVWQALRAIAPGSTVSYGEISQRIENPGAVRAVGAAIARNPISIIVPCHRVIGASGALTGYAGGLARKTALLRLEGALEPALL